MSQSRRRECGSMSARPRVGAPAGSRSAVDNSLALAGNDEGIDRTVASQLVIDFIGRQRQEPAGDALRVPADPLRSADRLANVPVHRALDRADIVDPGLDLDDDERACRLVEGKQIDPADIATALDPHLACDRPAGSLEPPLDIRGTQGMRGVTAPSAIDRDQPSDAQLEIDAEAVEQTRQHIETWIRFSRLHGRDHLPRDPGSLADVCLRPPVGRPGFAYHCSDAHSDTNATPGASTRDHGSIQAAHAKPPLNSADPATGNGESPTSERRQSPNPTGCRPAHARSYQRRHWGWRDRR